MPSRARQFALMIIAAGGLILISRLSQPVPQLDAVWLGCMLCAVIAGAIKLRLPGIDGTYSPTFVPILFSASYLELSGTLLVGCAAALSQSYLNVRRRSTALQALFNIANICISVTAVYLSQDLIQNAGIDRVGPAALMGAACVYFVMNTAIVSGVLARLQGTPLVSVLESWYFWSLPYFLTGVSLTTLATPRGLTFRWESMLLLIALLGLLHFYSTLASKSSRAQTAHQRITPAARVYYSVLLVIALALAGFALLHPGELAGARFAVFLSLALLASTWKVRLPGIDGTISANFVIFLLGILELSLSQIVIIAAAATVLQCLWRPARKPGFMPLAFSASVLTVSVALVHTIATRLSTLPLPAVLVIATAVLYGANTLLVSAMFCLIEGRRLNTIWSNCRVWTMNYYLVGAGVGAVVMASLQNSGLLGMLIAMLAMPLVWVSFRLQVARASAR